MKNTRLPDDQRDVRNAPLDRDDLLARDERGRMDERVDEPIRGSISDDDEDLAPEDEDVEKHEGDVLGLGTSDPDVHLPKPRTSRKSPRGIEVRTPATGIGDVPQRSGATGIDMGYSGEGTDIDSSTERPADDDRDE